MKTFVALDVSLEETAICIMLVDGSIAAEVTAASDPEAIAAELGRQEAAGPDALIGLEAGPLSEWIARGLADLGAPVVLMETRQIRAALSAMVVKADRNDARGIAQLLRMGWFRPVHLKSVDAREQRALLAARETLARRLKDDEVVVLAVVVPGQSLMDVVGQPCRIGLGRGCDLPQLSDGSGEDPDHLSAAVVTAV